jgi:hypothetical protein
MFHADEALAPSPFDCFEVPADIIIQAEEGPLMLSIEEYTTIFVTPPTDSPPATNTTTEGGTDSLFYSPPAGPVLGDLILSESWDESQSCPFDSYYSTAASPPPTDLGQDIPVVVIGANPDTYISLFDLLHKPDHKRRKHDFFHQIGGLGQAAHGGGYVCLRSKCRRKCSSKSEMIRHFYSKHLPPTIGCKDCNPYKTKRMDSFMKHCKKKHSGRSIEEFIVKLENPLIRFTSEVPNSALSSN